MSKEELKEVKAKLRKERRLRAETKPGILAKLVTGEQVRLLHYEEGEFLIDYEDQRDLEYISIDKLKYK